MCGFANPCKPFLKSSCSPLIFPTPPWTKIHSLHRWSYHNLPLCHIKKVNPEPYRHASSCPILRVTWYSKSNTKTTLNGCYSWEPLGVNQKNTRENAIKPLKIIKTNRYSKHNFSNWNWNQVEKGKGSKPKSSLSLENLSFSNGFVRIFLSCCLVDILDVCVSILNMLSYKMIFYLNMLFSWMKYRVLGDIYTCTIIIKKVFLDVNSIIFQGMLHL